jgi:protein TonB
MFDQTFVDAHVPARKPWTIAASLGVQTMFVGTLLLVPLLHPEILHTKVDVPLFVRLEPIHKLERVDTTPVPAGARTSAPRAFIAPPKIPDKIARIIDTNATAAPDTFAVAGPPIGALSGSGVISDLIGGIPSAPPPAAVKPAPAEKPAPPPTGPIHVSEGVQQAKLVFGPKPQYPPLAKAARVQGTVRIQAVIAADGTIGHLKAMTGPPLLVGPAVEAVSRWRYQPTLLNNRPVEVLTEIDVVFMLAP